MSPSLSLLNAALSCALPFSLLFIIKPSLWVVVFLLLGILIIHIWLLLHVFATNDTCPQNSACLVSLETKPRIFNTHVQNLVLYTDSPVCFVSILFFFFFMEIFSLQGMLHILWFFSYEWILLKNMVEDAFWL